MATNVLDRIDPKKLGEMLQQARKKCGMTQENAAKIIEASVTTTIAIEKGERRVKATELIKLARAYGQAVSDFVRLSRPSPVVEPCAVEFRADCQKEQRLEEIAYRADILPMHDRHLAIEALDRGILSEGRFAKLLGVNRLEAREIANKFRESSSRITE